MLRGATIVAKYSYLSDGTKLSATDASGVFDTFALYKSLGGEVFGTENEADFLYPDLSKHSADI